MKQVEFGQVFPSTTNCQVIRDDYGKHLAKAAYADWK